MSDREGKKRYNAYVDEVIAKAFDEALENDRENYKTFTDWLIKKQLEYIRNVKRKNNKV